ncbi:M56 family metallopeptidase [Pseudoxanthomonas sp.]|uniref:M56 family metallopeptidase n=1 Tax=Pseudoxanthomonas sp. TaxID=1871049 RepID=UPI0026010840|nr:M56 family metallopeptidase [Pseudoxanthomonas sp.]
MISATADWLLQVGSAHLLASLLIVPVACMTSRLRAIAPERRAGLLLLAFALVVLGPAVALQAGGLFAPTLQMVGGVETAAPRLADLPATSAQSAALTGIGITPAFAVLLLAVWLSGAAWHVVRLLVAHFGLRRIVASSYRARGLEDACRPLIPTDVDILVTPAFGPAAIGILQRKILLPRAMALDLPPDAVRAVVLHEATHHQRRDVHALLVQRLGEAVFWWNPLVRKLGRAADAAREVACDIRAARAFGAPTDYADALLDSITHLVPAPQHASAQALCAAASLSTLERRIDAIIESPDSPSRMGRMLLPSMTGALMLLCIGASLAAPDVGVRQAVDASATVAARHGQAVPQHEAALLDLHDRHSRAVYERHDRYTQTLLSLTEPYTRESNALAEAPPDDGKDARLERLNARYNRLFADNESRFREASAQAEARFLTARAALGNP